MAAITAAFVTQPVFGSVIDLDHQLIFTENSSSSLSATYDGATLTPTFVSTDEWTLQTNVRSLFVVVFRQWEEPGSASSINVFQLSGSNGLVTIDSDQSGGTVFGDGFTFVAVGTDSSDGVPIDVTFNDNGDTAAGVPDTGTTGSLLGFSLMGLAFLRRKLPARFLVAP